MGSSKIYNILIVEDSEPDQNMFLYLFENCPVPNQIHLASDGNEGRDMIFKRGNFQSQPSPDLIILDLNLPLLSGKELLQEIRKAPGLCHIPVVMITTSTSSNEVKEAYCLGANAFISKSFDIDDFQRKVNTLVQFWLECAILPLHT